MTRDEIIEVLKNGLSQIFKDAVITISVNRKNNNTRALGVTIHYTGTEFNVAPIIPIDGVVNGIQQHQWTLEEGVHMIADAYEANKAEVHISISRDMILSSLIYAPVNYEMNIDELELIPYRRFLDLAITYRFMVSEDNMYTSGSILVTEDLMEHFDISFDELEMTAKMHMKEEQVREIDLFSLAGEEPLPDIFAPKVLTYEKIDFGARVMLNKRYLSKYKTDLYIIPSSVNEVIIFADTLDYNYITETIRNMNENFVDPWEVLSNNLYFYDYRKNCIVIVED